MCGIYGFVSEDKSREDLIKATDRLILRGPDSGGYFFDAPIGLGHRRLSIIDLTTGNQPMYSENGDTVLVFNGEIYNFQSVRAELKAENCLFKTSSDTEVILHAYLKWGIHKCLQKLEGMFAFAIWDKNLNKLFITRDRFGEKPLYYTANEKGFFFASELKALKDHFTKDALSLEALNLYFELSYIPAPHTIYQNIYKLLPGQFIEVDSAAKYSLHTYYSLKEVATSARKSLILDYSEAKQELRNRLFESVETRMLSDVPLGSFLSGGIDSSIVSATMAKVADKPIKTFSIGFNEKAYDESDRAALVAKHIGSDHTLHIVNHTDLLNIVDDTLAYFDEPFGDSSAIPSMIVAKKAREKVTVVLTGDCADELFGGYEKYLGKFYAEKYSAYPKFLRNSFEKLIYKIPHTNLTNHSLRKIKKVIGSSHLSAQERYLQLTSLGFPLSKREKLFKPNFLKITSPQVLSKFNELGIEDELLQTFYSDIQLVLEGDMLAKVDRACMINSLEARVPFLDSKLVEFSFRLPHEFKLNGAVKKRILRESFTDLLPQDTFRFSKKGFDIPIRLWFKNELKNELAALINPDFLVKQNIFNVDYINELFNKHDAGIENNGSLLWLIYVFQKWYLNDNN